MRKAAGACRGGIESAWRITGARPYGLPPADNRASRHTIGATLQMIRRPFPDEWDTSQLLGSRRVYLESGLSFETIVARMASETQIIGVRIEPYGMPAPGEPKDARQIVFQVRVDHETCDLFYNAPDGLRGLYWQSPDHGAHATRHVIAALLPALMTFAKQNPPPPIGKAAPMIPEDIKASLVAPSAKIWPRERDDTDDLLLAADQPLVVPRWCENEQRAFINKGMWRRTPRGGELEIKGALLGRDHTEFIPKHKRDRSCQIHQFGFT
jgi:hypothetical protein